MKLDITKLDETLAEGVREAAGELRVELGGGLRVIAVKGESLKVEKYGDDVTVTYAKMCEFYRGLRLALTMKEDGVLEETSLFNHLGLMLDNSRNAVLNLPTAKKLIRIMAILGYDTCELYTEDTYEVTNEPYMGYLRGRFTKAELKELDAYGKTFGVELVPCVQMLAHYTAMTRWPAYANMVDCNDILLVGEDRTYEFIENIFKTLAECFTSRRVNIGMDEAHMVGLGKYLDKHGFRDRFDIMHEHLERVLAIAEKYGFTCGMWSDMFFRLAFNGDYYANKSIPEDVRAKTPKNVELIYWDYYTRERKGYDNMFRAHQEFGNPVSFAGGAWRWAGFAPYNKLSLENSKQAIDSCIKNGCKDVIVTMWGDNGSETSMFAVLPTIVYYAERAYGHKGGITAAFKSATGCSLQDFMLLDYPNFRSADFSTDKLENICKVMLYNDLLSGIFTEHASIEVAEFHESNVKKLKSAAKRGGDYRYVFETLAALEVVVAQKLRADATLRKAYLDGDKETLLTYGKSILPKLVRDLERFHTVFQVQWMTENKPYGFDVQDQRLGGLMQRMKSVAKRLTAYVYGDVDSIPEFEEERLAPKQDAVFCNYWLYNVSAQVV